MYLSTKTLFATFLLSTVVRGEFIRSSSVSASAHSDPVLRHLTSSGHDHDYGHFELTSVDTAKIFKFRDQFLKWKDAHSVVYESIELELHKMLVWVENHEFIHKHNNQTPSPSYTLGHNKFSDMTNDEFQKTNSLGKYSRAQPVLEQKRKERLAISKLQALDDEHPAKKEFRRLREKAVEYFDDLFSEDDAVKTDDTAPSTDDATPAPDDDDTDGLPDEIDWVDAGGVTPVKNQGRCGSCWAFSTTGAMEGAHFVEVGELVSLSEQNLMDCDNLDHSCEGGLMEDAFKFEESGNGLCSEEDYPYTATDEDECKTDCTKVPHTRVKDYIDITAGDKHGLLASIATQPTSIAMDAGSMTFQFYSGGVFDDDNCGADGAIDHGVLAVGYGHDEESGHKFFRVKNSWGDEWGDKGYFRIKRDSKNEFGTCAVLAYMTAPILDTDN